MKIGVVKEKKEKKTNLNDAIAEAEEGGVLPPEPAVDVEHRASRRARPLGLLGGEVNQRGRRLVLLVKELLEVLQQLHLLVELLRELVHRIALRVLSLAPTQNRSTTRH